MRVNANRIGPCRMLVVLSVALVATERTTATPSRAPVPAEIAKAERELAELGAKLHGSWVGGPCQGRLTFRPNGAYAWTGRGPGGVTDTGTWTVRGTALAPVLVLKCSSSDDEELAQTTAELPLVRVETTGFAFRTSADAEPTAFARPMTAPRKP